MTWSLEKGRLKTTKNMIKQRKLRANRIALGICVYCKTPVTGSTRCLECRKKHSDAYKARRKEREEKGLCTGCGGALPCERCNARRRKSHKKFRDQVHNHYGNQCQCCGESEPKFLSVDHINNDGAAHRREIGSGTRFYTWLINNNFPLGFQLLCFNCNHGKYINGGVCPHKSSHNKGNGE